MEKSPSQYISVRAVASALKEEFGVEMNISSVIAACRDALQKMGMMALSRHICIATVEDYRVMMDASVWKVRGVVRLDQPCYYPNGSVIFEEGVSLMQPQIIFVEPETEIVTSTPTVLKNNYIPQLKGPFVDYVWKKPLISFNETGMNVAIEYTSLMLDQEKLPMIPEPALRGCVHYALYYYYRPLYIAQQIPKYVMDDITAWKNQNMRQSEVRGLMESLTTNERNALMDIMSSFDRKMPNRPA